MIGLIKGTMRTKKALAGLPLPIASFRTNGNAPLLEVKTAITPVQSGSGDPYPAGGGKNKLSCTATTVTQDGVTFTVNADGTIATSNTASATTVLTVGSFNVTNGTTYILNGLPADGSNTTFGFQIKRGNYALNNDYSASGNSYTAEADETLTVAIVIRSGYNASGMLFKPMIRLSTVTDGTFAPYSNIRPISGWDSVKVSATGKNLLDSAYFADTDNWKTDIFPYGDYATSSSRRALLLDLKAGETYTFSFDITADNFPQYFYLCSGDPSTQQSYRPLRFSGSSFISATGTITAQAGLIYFLRAATLADITSDVITHTAQMELGSSATSYEVGSTQTATIPLPHTVYGGELDIVSGSGSETILGFNLKDISWTQNTYSQNIFNGTLPAKAKSQLTGYMAEEYKNTDSTSLINEDFSIAISSARTVVYVHDSRYNGVAEFMAGVNSKMAYELDTSTTLTTSPVALQARNGTNNVWADAGNISEIGYAVHQQYIGR